MREKGKLQAVLDFSSPSSSTSSAAATDENTASKSESPVHVHLVKTVLKKKVHSVITVGPYLVVMYYVCLFIT